MTDQQNREAYLGKLEAQIREWVSGIDNLAARSEHVGAESKLEFRRHINELRARGTAARAGLEVLREAPVESWDVVRVTTEGSIAELQEAVQEALERYP
jgi:hypothetical protein